MWVFMEINALNSRYLTTLNDNVIVRSIGEICDVIPSLDVRWRCRSRIFLDNSLTVVLQDVLLLVQLFR